MTKTQIAETLAGVRCLCALTRKQNLAIQSYLLAVIAGVSTDLASLVSASRCYLCLQPQQQDAALAYLLSQISGSTGTPAQIIAASPCVSCIPPGQYEAFKTYLLAIYAEVPVNAGTLLSLSKSFIGQSEKLLKSVQLYSIAVLNGGGGTPPEPPEPPFDGTLCAVTMTGGGGDRFDCYTVDHDITSLPNAGTAFTGLWLMGVNMMSYVYHDDFETYPVGAAGTLSDGEGFTGDWIYA